MERERLAGEGFTLRGFQSHNPIHSTCVDNVWLASYASLVSSLTNKFRKLIDAKMINCRNIGGFPTRFEAPQPCENLSSRARPTPGYLPSLSSSTPSRLSHSFPSLHFHAARSRVKKSVTCTKRIS